MNKQDVISKVNATLDEMALPAHCRSVRSVPSSVEVQVMVGGSQQTVRLRSGIGAAELEQHMARLRNAINERSGTIDIEEAVRAQRKASDVSEPVNP